MHKRHDLKCVFVLLYFSANRVNFLGHREKYGFHGFYFLFLFIYKYILDTSFIFVSCTFLEGEGEYVSMDSN